MGAWKEPSREKVSDSEVVGRRVCEDEVFSGRLTQGQPFKLRVDHFFDSDLKADLSVDRLGRSGQCENLPLRHTGTLASEEAARRLPALVFIGWGVIRVKSLRNAREFQRATDVVPRPVDEEPKNPYHAEITRDRFRDKVHAYGFAALLKDLADRELGFQRFDASRLPQTEVGRLGGPLNWLRHQFDRLVRALTK